MDFRARQKFEETEKNLKNSEETSKKNQVRHMIHYHINCIITNKFIFQIKDYVSSLKGLYSNGKKLKKWLLWASILAKIESTERY